MKKQTALVKALHRALISTINHCEKLDHARMVFFTLEIGYDVSSFKETYAEAISAENELREQLWNHGFKTEAGNKLRLVDVDQGDHKEWLTRPQWNK